MALPSVKLILNSGIIGNEDDSGQRKHRLMVTKKQTLAGLRLMIVADPDTYYFAPRAGKFEFHYYDEEEKEMVAIIKAQENGYLASDFVGKRLQVVATTVPFMDPIVKKEITGGGITDCSSLGSDDESKKKAAELREGVETDDKTNDPPQPTVRPCETKGGSNENGEKKRAAKSSRRHRGSTFRKDSPKASATDSTTKLQSDATTDTKPLDDLEAAKEIDFKTSTKASQRHEEFLQSQSEHVPLSVNIREKRGDVYRDGSTHKKRYRRSEHTREKENLYRRIRRETASEEDKQRYLELSGEVSLPQPYPDKALRKEKYMLYQRIRNNTASEEDKQRYLELSGEVSLPQTYPDQALRKEKDMLYHRIYNDTASEEDKQRYLELTVKTSLPTKRKRKRNPVPPEQRNLKQNKAS